MHTPLIIKMVIIIITTLIITITFVQYHISRETGIREAVNQAV